MLPGIDGLEVYRRLRSDTRTQHTDRHVDREGADAVIGRKAPATTPQTVGMKSSSRASRRGCSSRQSSGRGEGRALRRS
jgi:CheY-like chemotaxis protein